MDIGPVEYLVIGFPENKFKGEIAPELTKLVNSGLVRILDLIFIAKDADGNILSFEFDQREEFDAFAGLDAEVGGVISTEDIEHAASALDPDSACALLVWEDTWATPFAKAVRDAGGFIIEGARIPHELITEAMSALGEGD